MTQRNPATSITVPSGPKRRTHKRHDEIMTAASQMFVEKGYEQTSVQDVAESVGVLKGSLYYYIDSKEDLLFWVLQRNHQNLYDHVIDRQDYAALHPLDQLRTFVSRHVDYVLDNAKVSALYGREFPVLANVPHRRAEILAMRRGYEEFLVSLITQAQSKGYASPSADPVLSGRAILVMCNAAHQWFHPGGRFSKIQIINHHSNFAVRAIRVDNE